MGFGRDKGRDGPSTEEILKALSVLHPPAPVPVVVEERGLARHASTIIVAIILALMVWVGSTITSLSTNVTKISTNIDQMQRSLTDLQTSQSDSTKMIGTLQAGVASQSARNDAEEADINRVKERVRMLEGQKPITGVQ